MKQKILIQIILALIYIAMAQIFAYFTVENRIIREKENLYREAIQHKAGHYVVNPDNSYYFKWNDELTTKTLKPDNMKYILEKTNQYGYHSGIMMEMER